MSPRWFHTLLCAASILAALAAAAAPVPQATVYVIPIHGTIDLGLSGFVQRAVAEAQAQHADAVLLDINTFGGRVDACFEIVDALAALDPTPVLAHITREAWSAGALIAVAANHIYMAPASSIGSAEPRAMGPMGGGSEATDEKTVSALRTKFKAIAEERGHSVNLAQAMVDKDVQLVAVMIRGAQEILTEEEWEARRRALDAAGAAAADVRDERVLKPKGKLLNLTAREANALGLAALITSREEVLEVAGFRGARLVTLTPNWSEQIVRWLTHPIVSSLLLTLGFLGLMYEFKAGWGLTGGFALLALALYFGAHYLVGLANWFDILLFVTGVALLVLEIFLLPGAGLLAAGGLLCIVGGAFLALVKHPLEMPRVELWSAFSTVAYAVVGTFVLTLAAWRFIPQTGWWKRLVLAHGETHAAGYQSHDEALARLAGQTGVALTMLRPSGRGQFGEQIVDVVTEGDFIEQGQAVRVSLVEGGRVVVQRV